MSRCLSAPDASLPPKPTSIFSWIQALGTKRPVASPSHFCPASVVLFQLNGGHGQSYGLATDLLVSNAWIQLKIVKYWQWFWRQWWRDVASGADRHLDITFGLQVVESSSLLSVLFREAFSRPYISFFHFTSKWFLCYQRVLPTLYVGLAHTAPPFNTNFRLTFLLTQLLEALYEDIPAWSIKFESLPSLFWP